MQKNNSETMMKIEIWSDVVCPFCYIGKVRLEQALAEFDNKEDVEIVWKSFQLNPDLKTEPNKSLVHSLAESKGIGLRDAEEMIDMAVRMALSVGLIFNLDKAIPANTFRAHQLLHFAREFGKQNESKTALFKAYFTDGKNIDDVETLLAIAKEIGLDTKAFETAISNSKYVSAVRSDIEKARSLGVRGVPYFVFNSKYVVPGAQESTVFLATLVKAFGEWRNEHPTLPAETIDGKVCVPDAKCD